MHNETKVNTINGDVTSPDAKKSLLTPNCVGSVELGDGLNHPNPAFKHTERASYELGFLLRSLPRYLHGTPLKTEQLQEIEAADIHAVNCRNTLLDGLQSLGRVLWAAGVNEAFPADVGDCARVGMLVTEIALQIEFLNDFREDVAQHNLRTDQQAARKEGRA